MYIGCGHVTHTTTCTCTCRGYIQVPPEVAFFSLKKRVVLGVVLCCVALSVVSYVVHVQCTCTCTCGMHIFLAVVLK